MDWQSKGLYVMVGARPAEHTYFYPRSELALRHGAGVDAETSSPAEAQAGLPDWRPGRPDEWNALPWA
jgi:hypothetical protein